MMSSQTPISVLGTILVGAALLVAPPAADGASIIDSKHNLSAGGSFAVTAVSETRVCVFCHTPHNAAPGPYLWNRDEIPIFYDIYSSSTLNASVGQPSGHSKLCLSCHDGTIALGLVRSKTDPIAMAGGITVMPEGQTKLGTDLSDDHPISFPFDNFLLLDNPELADPISLTGAVQLDENQLVQCTSCHEPHNNQFGKFLVVDNTNAALCTTCHQRTNWTTSTHAVSTRTWNGSLPDPWPHTEHNQVDLNGCENCHRPHSSGSGERLLNAQVEEDNCLPCHNGNVALSNIEAELFKATFHPMNATTGVHDPKENTFTATRHVECVDCHNPHRVEPGSATPPVVPPRLQAVTGIDSTGAPVAEAQYLYEICYKCHADSTNKPPPTIPRLIPEDNLRVRFDPSNLSYHPIEAAGKNAFVPSLMLPLTTSSLIYCTDCHNNNNGPGAGGTGPRGPHGSANTFLLERRQVTQDPNPESATDYALCYKCHDRNNILDDRSFKKHKHHVEDNNVPCTVCHDPHGVASNTHLINFDLRSVSPNNSNGIILWEDLGEGRGQCSLLCHNKEHDQKKY